MTEIEVKELPEIVVDDDYEGLLSSYIELEAWRKIMFHRNFYLEHAKAELADDEEKALTEGPFQ